MFMIVSGLKIFSNFLIYYGTGLLCIVTFAHQKNPGY